jgi:glucosamine--fructose-6-phosphate aminotransferase (isomerizing)
MRSGIDVQVKIASEVLYEHVEVNNNTVFIFPSQSGETADSMEVIKYLQSKNAQILGIVNVVGSSISRLADAGMFTRCGYEI